MTEVLDQLATLSDQTRARLLLLLEQHELAVSELCAVLQLPQSTVSRHLRILADDGWVVARSEGTSRQYRMTSPLAAEQRRLWQLVSEGLAEAPQVVHDAERLKGVLAERRARSRAFFATSAGQWDAMRTELFGDTADLQALPALLDERWVVGDLGCGTGQLTATLAPFVARVIAVDESRAMLHAARRRLDGLDNVELRLGDLGSLPLEPAELDAALLMLVLHHAVDPERVLSEAARTLKPGGKVLVVDMVPHERDEYRQQMGHVWQGFSDGQIGAWMDTAGFDRVRVRRLPASPAARGPLLFAATGTRRDT